MCERVSDVYAKDYYAKSPRKDPVGPTQGDKSLVEYEVNLPKGGTYALSARVVTANYNQNIFVSANENEEPASMVMPFTCGQWQDSKAVPLSLKEGKNTLRLWRDNPPQKGIAVKSFTLRPAP